MKKKTDLQGSERDKWGKIKLKKEKSAQLYTFEKPVKEKVITQGNAFKLHLITSKTTDGPWYANLRYCQRSKWKQIL